MPKAMQTYVPDHAAALATTPARRGGHG